MTALRRRRTRSTVVALVAAVGGLLTVAALGVAGARTLADSTEGRRAVGSADTIVSQRLPFTPTALVGVVDDDGRLTSTVVMTLRPDAVGGSIVAVAASADASNGTTGELAPLAAVLEVSGPVVYRESVERMTGLSFDVIEIVDAERFAELVTPLGDIPATFAVALSDASSGEEWPADEVVLGAPSAARAVTASDPSIADWYLEAGRSSVWRAVADRVGAGIGSAEPITADDEPVAPASLDEFLDRLFAARVDFRALGFTPIDDERVEEQLSADLADAFGPDASVSAVAHDRAELLMVLGAVAPGRLGAPLEAPSFRIVSGYTDDAVGSLELNRSDVIKRAIDRLLFVQVNIVSVADLPGETVPEVTRLLVADPEIAGGVEETYADLFGEIEVVAAETAIDGVDVEVVLGRSFLDELRGESGDVVAGSGGDANDDTTDDE